LLYHVFLLSRVITLYLIQQNMQSNVDRAKLPSQSALTNTDKSVLLTLNSRQSASTDDVTLRNCSIVQLELLNLLTIILMDEPVFVALKFVVY